MAEDARARPEILSIEEKIAMAMKGINESSSRTTRSPARAKGPTKSPVASNELSIESSVTAPMSSSSSSPSSSANIDSEVDGFLHDLAPKERRRSYESKLLKIHPASPRRPRASSDAVTEVKNMSTGNFPVHNNDINGVTKVLVRQPVECIPPKPVLESKSLDTNSPGRISMSSSAKIGFVTSATATTPIAAMPPEIGEMKSILTSPEVTKLLLTEETPPESPASPNSTRAESTTELTNVNDTQVGSYQHRPETPSQNATVPIDVSNDAKSREESNSLGAVSVSENLLLESESEINNLHEFFPASRVVNDTSAQSPEIVAVESPFSINDLNETEPSLTDITSVTESTLNRVFDPLLTDELPATCAAENEELGNKMDLLPQADCGKCRSFLRLKNTSN